MIDTYTARDRYELAFSQVMDIYVHLVSTDGQHKQTYGKLPKTKGNTRLIQPSDQDFLADVDLVIKRILHTKTELDNLESVLYNDHDFYEGPIPPKIDPDQKRRIKQRIGRELIRRKIYPVKAYFRGKVV